jgi:O-antigen/teichoic acid export membrane protein
MATARPLFITRCAELVTTYSNVLLVGYLAGPAAAGVYFAAERLAQLAVIPKTVVSIINQQSMAAAHATGRRRELQLLATQSAHGALWPTLLIGTFLALFATPLLGLFGSDFSAASPVLLVLVASGIINVFTGPAQDILIMTGRQKRIPAVIITAALGHVAALFLLVPAHGAVGAAMASVVSACIAQFWLMRLAHREAGIATTVLASLGQPRR